MRGCSGRRNIRGGNHLQLAILEPLVLQNLKSDQQGQARKQRGGIFAPSLLRQPRQFQRLLRRTRRQTNLNLPPAMRRERAVRGDAARCSAHLLIYECNWSLALSGPSGSCASTAAHRKGNKGCGDSVFLESIETRRCSMPHNSQSIAVRLTELLAGNATTQPTI